MNIIPQSPIILLAAVDYSELSQLVIEYAVDTMRRNLGEAHFLHVSNDAPSSAIENSRRNAELLDWIGQKLAATVGIPGAVTVVAHEAHGDPAKVIVQTASDLRADVVIVGTHGRRGVQRVMMGSTAEMVVRRSGCPVLVVRPKVHEHGAPEIEAPCARCVATRVESQGALFWCAQHQERHGRRHTYYDARAGSWVTERLSL